MTIDDEPTPATQELHAEALTDPVFDWDDRTDFEWASRGLIVRPDDPHIADADGEIVWHHELFESFLHGEVPDTVHPSLWRHALLNNYRGLFEVCDGVYQVRGESLANVTFVRGDTGWIVVDPLTTVEVAAYALSLIFEHVEQLPVAAVVYSHTHSDHFGGVKGVVSEDDVTAGRVRVIGPAGFTEWVLKEQGLAAEGMPSRNAYMYGENLEVGPTGIVDTGLGQAIEGGAVSFIEPTDIVTHDGATLTVDGVEMVFTHAPGEAPTGIHTYFPSYQVLHCADNCYMCLHNIYTIRGAFPRDAMAWASSVDGLLAYDGAEVLISGHNWPVFGREAIGTFVAQQRDGIRYIHDQTLRLMSHGYTPAEIANTIEFPPELARLWHLRGYYGAIAHNVRGIYAYYLGWYDGNPANLDELAPRDRSARTIDYMGGVESVLQRAEADFDSGEYRWVAQVVDLIMWVEPHNQRARELAARAHTQLGYQAENATWRNAYLGAAKELREGLPAPRNARVLRDVMKGMEPLSLLNGLSVRLDGPAAAGMSATVGWRLSDTGDECHSSLRHGVFHHELGAAADPSVIVNLDSITLADIAIGHVDVNAFAERGVIIDGDETVLLRIFELLDDFEPWFPIASHDVKNGEGTSRST